MGEIDKEKRDKHLIIRLTESEFMALKKMADLHESTMSEVVRNSLQFVFQSIKKEK